MRKVTKCKQTVNGKKVSEKITKHNCLELSQLYSNAEMNYL